MIWSPTSPVSGGAAGGKIICNSPGPVRSM
jgi:hypothetical protein